MKSPSGNNKGLIQVTLLFSNTWKNQINKGSVAIVMLLGVSLNVPHPASGEVPFCHSMQNISQLSKLFESGNRNQILTKKYICLTHLFPMHPFSTP